MEKLIRSYDKEYMKMAILKHEETFKEQVYELHRLYQIQKMLMTSIQSNNQNVQKQDIRDSKNRFNSSQIGYSTQQKPQPALDLERPAEEYIAESAEERVLETEDASEREIELTLGLASYYTRKKPETPPNSDSGQSFSSSSTISRTKKGKSSARDSHHCRVLTNTRNEELSNHKWGLIKVPHDSSLALTHGRNNRFDVDEQLGQDRHERPHWLFQALSLNMT